PTLYFENGECTICKEIREGSKYRKVSEDSKIKAEAGGYNNLSISNLICNVCHQL
ncbi:13741_t:CDS:1, partial [Entrophospora sp. SA101]